MQKYYSKILKKYSKYILINSLMILSVYACSEIEAVDISNEELSSIMPTENSILTTNTVNFKWSVVEEASQYQIQIVKPNFTTPIEFTIDSLVTSTDMSFTLSPSNYQWKVRAVNNISETSFTEPISFEVDEVIELTDQTITLNSPENEAYFNAIQNNFSWGLLSAADSYLFQLIKGNEFSNDILEQNTTTNNYYSPSTQNLLEGVYTWKVKAINTFSETSFTFRNFYIDTTVPNTPTLLSPNNNETTTISVDFSWNIGVDGGTTQAPITTVLEIATMSNFNTIFDSVELSNNQHTYTFTTIGDYYWRVRTFDSAGNLGANSEVRQITVE